MKEYFNNQFGALQVYMTILGYNGEFGRSLCPKGKILAVAKGLSWA